MKEKFILTRELGRLAKWLRILGYDSVYYKQEKLSSLLIIALRQDRIIITRNTKFGQHRGVKIVKINSDFVKHQLVQVLDELNLGPDKELMFSRCIICNVELADVKKSDIKDKVPEFVYNTQDEFVKCPKCERIYWQGTHWGNVSKTLEEVMNSNQPRM